MTDTVNKNRKVAAGVGVGVRGVVVVIGHAEEQSHEAGGWVGLMANVG